MTFRSQIVFILIRLIDATLLIRNSRTVQKKRVLLVNCSDIVLTVFTVNLPRQYQLAMFSFLSGTVSALKKRLSVCGRDVHRKNEPFPPFSRFLSTFFLAFGNLRQS